MAANKYKVPKKEWNKWTSEGRKVFNAVYYAMVNDQKLFLHPDADPQPQTQWKTLAWNAAFIAADSLRD